MDIKILHNTNTNLHATLSFHLFRLSKFSIRSRGNYSWKSTDLGDSTLPPRCHQVRNTAATVFLTPERASCHLIAITLIQEYCCGNSFTSQMPHPSNSIQAVKQQFTAAAEANNNNNKVSRALQGKNNQELLTSHETSSTVSFTLKVLLSPYSILLQAWTFWSRIRCLHLCPKMLQCCKFAEKSSNNFLRYLFNNVSVSGHTWMHPRTWQEHYSFWRTTWAEGYSLHSLLCLQWPNRHRPGNVRPSYPV